MEVLEIGHDEPVEELHKNETDVFKILKPFDGFIVQSTQALDEFDHIDIRNLQKFPKWLIKSPNNSTLFVAFSTKKGIYIMHRDLGTEMCFLELTRRGYVFFVGDKQLGTFIKEPNNYIAKIEGKQQVPFTVIVKAPSIKTAETPSADIMQNGQVIGKITPAYDKAIRFQFEQILKSKEKLLLIAAAFVKRIAAFGEIGMSTNSPGGDKKSLLYLCLCCTTLIEFS